MTNHNVSEAQLNYIKKHKRNKTFILWCQIVIFIIFVASWELSAYYKLIDPFIFSSPSRIIKCFAGMAANGMIFYHIGITLFETLLSFSLVTLAGILIAIALWWNKTTAKILEPYLVVLNSLPKSALAPILIVWLGNNMKTIIITSIAVAIVVTIINVYTGFINVDEDMIKLIYTFNGTKKDVLTKVVIPSNISTIISTMKVNIGLALIGVIIGEFLAAKAGIGYLIIYGSQVFKLDWVMMSIIILALIATGLYQFTSFLEKKTK